MERYPDSFKIIHYREVKYGMDVVTEPDPTKEDFLFAGRIRISQNQYDAGIKGDLAKATNVIHCPVTGYKFEIGQEVTDQGTGKKYEILLPFNGQKGSKLWVASI